MGLMNMTYSMLLTQSTNLSRTPKSICPIEAVDNAQIRLYPNGDFTTRSNDVETVCRRVNPDDWDDDGIPNDSDLNPLVCDGDFFGPANILPDGARLVPAVA